MSEFGLPQRNATQDANAGIINPPSIKREARSQNLTKEKQQTSLDVGVEKMGASLGNALAKGLDKKKVHINEQRALEATVRQGTDHAINETDKIKKRTGWEKFVYGENVEYRAAQQQAAANSVQAHYLDELSKVSEYAGHNPDEYKERLKTGLNKVLDKYVGDKETQNIVSSAWLAASGKLSAKQFQENYAYTQTQAQEASRMQIKQTFDQFTLENKVATSPEESENLQSGMLAIFKGSLKGKSQSDESYRTLLNEEVNFALRNGNFMPQQFATLSGWNTKLNPAELAKRKGAESVYDTTYAQRVGTMLSDGELTAVEASSKADAIAAYNVMDDRLEDLEARKSGTERSEKILADAKLRIANGRKAALLAGSKAELKAKELQDKTATWGITNLEDRTSLQSQYNMTSKEMGDTADNYVIQMIGGQENPTMTMSEGLAVIYENPDIRNRVAAFYKSVNMTSPMVKRMVEQFTGNWYGTFNPETHRPTPATLKQSENIGRFLDIPSFKKSVGDEYDSLWEIQKGIRTGATEEQINQSIERYAEQKGNLDAWKSGWPLAKDESNQDYVKKLVYSQTGVNPTAYSTGDFMEMYRRGLIHSNGDHQAAATYLKKAVNSDSANFRGRVIWGGANLDNSSAPYTFDTLLNAAEGAALLGPVLSMAGVAPVDGVPPHKLSQLTTDWQMEMDPYGNGVLLTSAAFTQPALIKYSDLEQWKQVIEIKNLIAQKEQDIKAAALAKEAGQYDGQLRYVN